MVLEGEGRMGGRVRRKMASNGGLINRATAILLVLIGIMVVLIEIPGWRVFVFRAQKTACNEAIKSAEDGLIIEFLSRYKEASVEEARAVLDEVLPERPNICPAGGTVYLILGENGIYKPVCGLHDSDLKERTRLNAARVRDLLFAAREKPRKIGIDPEEENFKININGKDLKCQRVLERVQLFRGTRTTAGFEGVVCYYGVAGSGEFKDSSAKKGTICYFLYADEECCALWQTEDGWTGLAYS